MAADAALLAHLRAHFLGQPLAYSITILNPVENASNTPPAVQKHNGIINTNCRSSPDGNMEKLQAAIDRYPGIKLHFSDPGNLGCVPRSEEPKLTIPALIQSSV